MSVEDVLNEYLKLYAERNLVYKDSYKRIGPVIVGLFPDGIDLVSETDHTRFRLLEAIVVKLIRYTQNWEKGHADSLRDLAVYAAMLESYDSAISGASDVVGNPPGPFVKIRPTCCRRGVSTNYREHDPGCTLPPNAWNYS